MVGRMIVHFIVDCVVTARHVVIVRCDSVMNHIVVCSWRKFDVRFGFAGDWRIVQDCLRAWSSWLSESCRVGPCSVSMTFFEDWSESNAQVFVSSMSVEAPVGALLVTAVWSFLFNVSGSRGGTSSCPASVVSSACRMPSVAPLMVNLRLNFKWKPKISTTKLMKLALSSCSVQWSGGKTSWKC